MRYHFRRGGVRMKLLLPNNKKIYLPDNASLEERKEKVNEILNEWEDYFRKAWHSSKTKIALHVLASYLCWGYHKDKNAEKGKRTEDKYVWSNQKEKKVKYGDGVTILFSDLSMKDKIRLGVPHCYNDENEESHE